MEARTSLLSLLLFLLCAACAPTAATPVQSLKLFIAEPGVYRLTQSDLPAGFDLSADTLPQLRLTHKGIAAPIEVEQTGGAVAIIFYAAPDESLYSVSDVYWLALSDGGGMRVQTRTIAPARAALIAQRVMATAHFAEDRLYFPTALGDTHWFWDSLTAPAEKRFTLDLPSLTAGEATIEIALAGATWGAHRVQVRLNDQLVGEANWNGQSPYRFQTKTSNLRAGQNSLTLVAPNSSDSAAIAFLDAISVTYPREFVALDDQFAFVGDGGDYRIRGFRTEDIRLYDVTDPHHSVMLSGFTRTSDALSFHDELTQRHYVAVSARAFKKPLAIRAAKPNNLRAAAQRADEIVIAPAEFREALAPLIKHRNERGLQIQFVDIEQVYDAFSDGVPDPHALRDFLTSVREQWTPPAPRFALLVGKASYDYRDNLKGPNKSLVPAYLLHTPDLGEAASEDWFAQLTEREFRPALAIGRIPARTPAQVSTAVQKIIAYESRSTADWGRRAVFVSDNLEADFERHADRLARQLASRMERQMIFLSRYGGNLAAARADLIREWNAGALLMTYIGHGSINLWAAGPLFSSDDVGALHNGERLPVLLTPTCLDGFFYHPQQDSLAEALLFKNNGGIVAGFVPTGFSLQMAQDTLMTALFAELFTQPAPTLGEAILRAKLKVAASLPEMSETDAADLREVLETFALLGDPALKWEAPQ